MSDSTRPLMAIPLAALVALAGAFVWRMNWTRSPYAAHDDTPTAVGTSGELPDVPSYAVIGTPLGELFDLGDPDERRRLIGRRVRLVVDMQRAANDTAFWVGTPPDDLLVVLDRSAGSIVERGRPSGVPLGSLDAGGRYLTVGGVIEPVPPPQGMFSWGLTERDAALLAERGVYVRVDTVLSPAPDPGAPPSTADREE